MSWARERPRDELRQDPTPGRAGRPSWRSSNSARTTRADRRVLAADPGGVRPGGVRPPGKRSGLSLASEQAKATGQTIINLEWILIIWQQIQT